MNCRPIHLSVVYHLSFGSMGRNDSFYTTKDWDKAIKIGRRIAEVLKDENADDGVFSIDNMDVMLRACDTDERGFGILIGDGVNLSTDDLGIAASRLKDAIDSTEHF